MKLCRLSKLIPTALLCIDLGCVVAIMSNEKKMVYVQPNLCAMKSTKLNNSHTTSHQRITRRVMRKRTSEHINVNSRTPPDSNTTPSLPSHNHQTQTLQPPHSLSKHSTYRVWSC